MDIELVVHPRRVVRILCIITLILLVMHIGALIGRFYFGHPTMKGLVPRFDLDEEGNVPTWYSGLLLMLSAVLMGIIAQAERAAARPHVRYWAFLAIIFTLLSVDEVAGIHELLTEPLRTALGTRGVIYYAWVIPAAGFVAVLGLVYARFLFSLQASTRNWLLVAAAVYVGGALGVEMLGGWYDERYGAQQLAYAAITTVEEVLELLGILILIYSLLHHIAGHAGAVRFRFGDAGISR